MNQNRIPIRRHEPSNEDGTNGTHNRLNGTPLMTTTENPPTVIGTPVNTLPVTAPTASTEIVDELGRVVKLAKGRIEDINARKVETEKKAEADKQRIDAEAKAEREALEKEEAVLREQLLGVGVTLAAPAAPRVITARPTGTPEVTRPRIGRPPGSKNKKTVSSAPVKSKPVKKKVGRPKKAPTVVETDKTAPELIFDLLMDNGGEGVLLKEIRGHLLAHGKKSNPSVVTKSMCDSDRLVLRGKKFFIGRNAAV